MSPRKATPASSNALARETEREVSSLSQSHQLIGGQSQNTEHQVSDYLGVTLDHDRIAAKLVLEPTVAARGGGALVVADGFGPLLAGNEMANPSIGYVIEKIKVLPEYTGCFENAFAGRGPDALTVGQALAAYQRTLVSANSHFDRWHYGKEDGVLSAEAQAGFRLFSGKAGCSPCHVVGESNAFFTDHRFHNAGIGYANSMALPRKHRVQLSPRQSHTQTS